MLERGTLVGLRTIAPVDVTETYLGWLKDPLVIRFLEVRFTERNLATLRAFVDRCLGDPQLLLLAVIDLHTRAHVGNVKIGPIDTHHLTADLGLLIGERKVWGQGFGTEAIILATRHAFATLGLRKLTASCYSGNLGSRAAFRRAGWIEEGLRGAQFLDEVRAPHDQVLFASHGQPSA